MPAGATGRVYSVTMPQRIRQVLAILGMAGYGTLALTPLLHAASERLSAPAAIEADHTAKCPTLHSAAACGSLGISLLSHPVRPAIAPAPTRGTAPNPRDLAPYRPPAPANPVRAPPPA